MWKRWICKLRSFLDREFTVLTNAWIYFGTLWYGSAHSGVAIEAAKSFFLLYFRRKCMCAKTFSALLHHFFCHWVCISPTDLHNFCNCWFKLNIYRPKCINLTMVGFIYIQILVNSHYYLVNSVLALDATEKVSQTVNEMAIELINIHLISVLQKIWV